MRGLTNPLSRINVKSPFCISSTFVKVGGTTVFFSGLSCQVFCTEVLQRLFRFATRTSCASVVALTFKGL